MVNHPEIEPIRDKTNCTFGISISHFEEEIGKAEKVVVLASIDYLESVSGMYDAAGIIANGDWRNRAVFISCGGIKRGYRDEDRTEFDRLRNKYTEEKEKIDKWIADGRKPGVYEERHKRVYDLIVEHFSEIYDALCDVNTLNLQAVTDNDCAEVIKKLGFEPVEANNKELSTPSVNANEANPNSGKFVNNIKAEKVIVNNIGGDADGFSFNL